jgi:aminoglycoside phosphotransferase (APT) family kinase protein
VESLHFRDVWQPYVVAALARHGIAARSLDAGFVGKYPTFLVGDLVVKLFGRFPTWHNDHAVELSMQQLLHDQPTIPAPALIHHGNLYDAAEPWPYLITERLHGTAWRETTLGASSQHQIAGRLGEITRALHAIPVSNIPPYQHNWLTDERPRTIERLRVAGTLPPHLIEQVDDYLTEPSPDRCLTHGDLTEDHLFIDHNRLVGIIDWGDAQATDPYYELGPLYLGAFAGNKAVLRAYLAGYQWPMGNDFAHHAMSISLIHRKAEFLVRRMQDAVDLNSFATLADLAGALWN